MKPGILLNLTLSTTLVLLANISLAECFMTTNQPFEMAEFPGITQFKLDTDEGNLAASLENGDQLLVHFSQCGLAATGYYFVKDKTEPESLMLLAREFFKHMEMGPANEKNLKAFDNQANFKVLTSEDGLTLSNSHVVWIKNSKSSLYEHEIRYDWLPPLH